MIPVLLVLALFVPVLAQNECEDWQTTHPEWIFCDDFEDTSALVRTGRYFEYGDNQGDFIPIDTVGLNGSRGMRVKWQATEVGAGGLKLAFGRNPNAYMNKQNIRPGQDFREIYYRQYLKMQPGWQGKDPAKLSRATIFTSSSDWRQAMIAHLWSDDSGHLLIDPASCVDASSQVVCQTYNDFSALSWLGNRSGTTPIFTSGYDGVWYCVEAHVKLNDTGQSNGVQEFWIDGNLEARREGLNFVRSYSDYAINAVFFENYWNRGSPVEQERYFDNIVVSTQPIGCVDTSPVSALPRRPGAPYARVYPNPAGIRFFVSVYGMNGLAARASLYGLRGNRVARVILRDNAATPFPVDGLAAGLYFLKVEGSGFRHSQKLLKIR
jgi:hypothetical protein